MLAEFENKTGDPVFDETLRQGLGGATGTVPVPQLSSRINRSSRYCVS